MDANKQLPEPSAHARRMAGTASIGDTLVFELRVATTNGAAPPPTSDITYSLYSDPTLNPDSEEHTLASPFTTGDFGIPNGTFVGFEDIIPLSASDLDYNDHQFVFTNVTAVTHSVPEGGASIAMLGLGLLGVGLARSGMRRAKHC